MSIVVPARYPRRYRTLPIGPVQRAQFQAERDALLERAEVIDQAQRSLGAQLAEIRSDLARIRVVMWPRVEPKDIVQGFRHTRVKGPPPIPPVAPNALPLRGRELRFALLAILAHHQRPMRLVEIHRALHLQGYAINSRFPVKRLADALGYETREGRAFRVDHGVYALGTLKPSERRKLALTTQTWAPGSTREAS